jgi:hypothetical protein
VTDVPIRPATFELLGDAWRLDDHAQTAFFTWMSPIDGTDYAVDRQIRVNSRLMRSRARASYLMNRPIAVAEKPLGWFASSSVRRGRGRSAATFRRSTPAAASRFTAK